MDNTFDTFKFELRKAGSGDSRSYPVTVSTDTPIIKHDAGEYRNETAFVILDHSNINLSRAPLPVIESHKIDELNIGIVDNLCVDSGKLKGHMRLGASTRAKEVAADIDAGIVRNLSLGAEIIEMSVIGEKDNLPLYQYKIMPYEVSLVSAGADINAGILRSRGNAMSESTEEQKTTRSARRLENIALEQERKRVSEIFRIAGEFSDDIEHRNLYGAAEEFADQGKSLKSFKQYVLNELGKRHQQPAGLRCTSAGGLVDRFGNERSNNSHSNYGYGDSLKNYSLTKIIRGISNPKELRSAGFELEISRDLERRLGKQTSGVLVPFEALETRAVVKSGTGSNVIRTEYISQSFIDVLRARSVLMNIVPSSSILRGLEGDVAIPKKISGSSGYWIGGDNADSLTESDMVLGQVTMSPKTLGGATTFSHKMLIQSSPDIEQLVRLDLGDMLAQEIDNKGFQGNGAGNVPVGVLNQSGIGTNTYTNGGSPSYADIVGLESYLAANDADIGNLAYVTTPGLKGTLKTTDVGTDTGQFVWGKGNQPGVGELNSLPAFSSTNIPDGYVVFGNWADLLIGFWGAIEIDADPYGSNFLKGSTTVRIMADIDFAVRHAESFTEIHEAAP